MGTALAVRQTSLDNPANLGDKRAIQQVRDRIMTMMPGAADAPADVVWAAAQLAVAYQLDPFNGEIYIMKLGSKKVGDAWVDDYRAHVGIKGLRKKAREQAQFMTDFRTLTPEEVKLARRDDYDAGDVGVECTLYRLDIASQCQRLGIPYKPFRATGYWRVKAKYNKRDQKWDADSIPNTWTAVDVAEKRAEINAIKRAYDLTVNVADPALIDDEEAASVIGHKLHQQDMNNAPVLDKDIQYEEDGDILYATTQHRNVVAGQAEEEGAFRQADEPPAPAIDRVEPGSEADPDNPFDNPNLGVAAEETRDYAAIADRLTGKTKDLADWASKLHGKSKGDASKAQYGFLCKEINKHTGDAHTHVLSVLCRQHISRSHPCGADLASKLLDVILTEVPQTDAAGAKVKANGKQVYVANPRFRQDIADHLKEIAQAK